MRATILIVTLTALTGSYAFAAGPDEACITRVKTHSRQIKKDALEIIKDVQQEAKAQMKELGEVTLGNLEREEAQGASHVLKATRKLVAGKSLTFEDSELINALCKFDLDVDQASSNSP